MDRRSPRAKSAKRNCCATVRFGGLTEVFFVFSIGVDVFFVEVVVGTLFILYIYIGYILHIMYIYIYFQYTHMDSNIIYSCYIHGFKCIYMFESAFWIVGGSSDFCWGDLTWITEVKMS